VTRFFVLHNLCFRPGFTRGFSLSLIRGRSTLCPEVIRILSPGTHLSA